MTEKVGDKLRIMREKRLIGLEQAAQTTRIRLYYLKAIETGDYTQMPSLTQLRGFIRMYASYLSLDPDEILNQLTTEMENPDDSTGSPKDVVSQPSESKDESPVELPASSRIFLEIGEKLHNQRLLLELSLEDVERHTHLRQHYLEALESGDLERLPSPVQAKGMLGNYANFLGLDSDPLLLRFAEGLQEKLAENKLQSEVPDKPRRTPARRTVKPVSPLRRLFSLDALIWGLLIIFLIGFVAWGTGRVSALQREGANATPSSTAPSVAEVLMLDPTATPTPSATPPGTQIVNTAVAVSEVGQETQPAGGEENPSEAASLEETPQPGEAQTQPAAQVTGTVPASIPSNSSDPVQVYLIVRQRAWVRVTVDGKVEFEGRVTPGSAYPFYGSERIELITGNAAGLQVYFNQADLGILGAFGEVVDRVFTLQGMQTPTPAASPTPAPSSTPTVTPTPTATGMVTPGG